MSFRVLVIPEDPTHNGAILQPLVERMMESCRRSHAKVTVLTEPHLRGISGIKRKIDDILELYQHFDLLLCLVDADTEDRAAMLKGLEERARQRGKILLGCQAEKEIEVWLLAGHTEKLQQSWKAIRNDPSVKENHFEPFLAKYGSKNGSSGGRDILMREALRNYKGILDRCPELRDLETRIKAALR